MPAKPKSQPVVVTIGYQDILLPDLTGVDALIRTLAKALPCSYRSYRGQVELASKGLEVSMKVLPYGTKFVREGAHESDLMDDLDGLPHKNGLPLKNGLPDKRCLEGPR